MEGLRLALPLLLILLLSACGEPDTSDGGEVDGGEAGATVSLGEAARDGQFQFTVSDFRCGARRLGKGITATKAQGEFCIAEMRVENIGNEPQLLDSSSQYLFIGDKKYEASGEVAVSVKAAEKFFLENSNPGNKVEGIVAWDVPRGAKPDRLELHDSPFSGGVTVEL